MKDTKKTTPRQENSLKRDNIIGSKRFNQLSEEKQTIVILYHKVELPRKDIEPLIRNNYFPNPAKRLRDIHGFDMKWKRYDYINDLGKPKWYGIWYLTPEDKKRAREFVGEFI